MFKENEFCNWMCKTRVKIFGVFTGYNPLCANRTVVVVFLTAQLVSLVYNRINTLLLIVDLS